MTTKANESLKPLVLSLLGVGLWLTSSPSGAACLVKMTQDGNGKTVPTLMLAPEREVADYAALGFVRAQCPQDMSIVRQYVERLCAEPGQSGIRALNTEMAIGRERARACDSARAGLAEAGG